MIYSKHNADYCIISLSLVHNVYKGLLSNTRRDLKDRRGENSIPGARRLN